MGGTISRGELEIIAGRQESIARQYADARAFYRKYSSQPFAGHSLTLLQRDAAECALHVRWMLGIEPTCTCCED